MLILGNITCSDSFMRVISGLLKGKILKSPDGIRPLTDMIKEAIFDILQKVNWKEANVLDLFAGSGNFGIEALSRGARSVIFVDRNPKSKFFIKNNLQGCSFDYKILIGDVFVILKKLFKNGTKFNIIFADPPFDFLLGNKIIQEIVEKGILENDGFLIIRLRNKESIFLPYGFDKDIRKYGDSIVYFLRKQN